MANDNNSGVHPPDHDNMCVAADPVTRRHKSQQTYDRI
jgi:hypothetical protein